MKKVEVDGDYAARFGIRYHEGYASPFTREQSPLARYRNGARVRKAKVDRAGRHGEHPIGSLGTVLGSIGRADIGVAYFVEWDESPGAPTVVYEGKIERA